ncbi:hypothetical protein [Flavobacterium sp.]|uniref:hypothetical protein n=1 Tax=Flavobacterium sp. TaxID=239 RepID=UPI00121AA662|nr:hypothetical protein [Flavobacterium sp.]RZJ70046.1 MAG: hypothetical protein EOO49_15445 [Flavobacterium sp.]
MKIKQTLFTLLLALGFFASADAQVSVNVNVGTPPVWAPATPAGVEYYYIPDIDSYYDIRTTEYIYPTNGRWIRSRALPSAYRTYRPSAPRTVIVNNYHGRSPWVTHKTYKVKKVKGPKHHGRGHGKGHGKH